MLKSWNKLLHRRLSFVSPSPVLRTLAAPPALLRSSLVLPHRLAFSTSLPGNPSDPSDPSDPPSSPPKKRRRGRPSRQSKTSSSPDAPSESNKTPGYSFESWSETQLEEGEAPPIERIYVMKFNAPITPFSKFPLQQNKYIQEFFKRYEDDKKHVSKVLAVHFSENKNENAAGSCGIEIELVKKNSLNYVESKNFRRYSVLSFDEASNFCEAQEVVDAVSELSTDQ